MTEDRHGRVLVVEDEVLVAMMLEDTLVELGYAVVGLAHRLQDGLCAAERDDIDVALLDINLDGQRSLPIADRLAARGIPFAFSTGYGSVALGGAHPKVPILRKPFSGDDLRRTLAQLRA
ncbi:MAG: response regulator [Salinarimonas sp.]